MLTDARSGLSRLSASALHAAVSAGIARIVDVRTAEHRSRDGGLPTALAISLNVLEWRLDPSSPSRHPDAPGLADLVVVVCEQGYSSSLAAARLQQLGFVRATDLVGGFEAWQAAGLPVIGPVGSGRDIPPVPAG
jgi:rhodanese-related sulfurtransferase